MRKPLLSALLLGLLALVVFVTGPFFFQYFEWAATVPHNAGYWLLFSSSEIPTTAR